jgi:uncharacterized protein
MEAFLLDTETGARLCVRHRPHFDGARLGGVLYVHPFAEEMNKSRRIAAEQARALSAFGWDVLQIDLLGCGDSAGDFGQATWEAWHSDVRLAHQWLRERVTGPVWLWGLRAGCLLACEAASRMPEETSLLLWQPVLSGRQYLQQLLRLRMLTEMLGEERSQRGGAALRQQLAAEGVLEVGGYAISERLATGLELAELATPRAGTRALWIEVSSRDAADPSPGAIGRVTEWRARGVRPTVEVVAGPPFWQTLEIAECPQLTARTTALMAAEKS